MARGGPGRELPQPGRSVGRRRTGGRGWLLEIARGIAPRPDRPSPSCGLWDENGRPSDQASEPDYPIRSQSCSKETQDDPVTYCFSDAALWSGRCSGSDHPSQRDFTNYRQCHLSNVPSFWAFARRVQRELGWSGRQRFDRPLTDLGLRLCQWLSVFDCSQCQLYVLDGRLRALLWHL